MFYKIITGFAVDEAVQENNENKIMIFSSFEEAFNDTNKCDEFLLYDTVLGENCKFEANEKYEIILENILKLKINYPNAFIKFVVTTNEVKYIKNINEYQKNGVVLIEKDSNEVIDISPADKKISVLVAGNDVIIQRVKFIQSIKVVGEAISSDDLIKKAQKNQPDIIFLTQDLPDNNKQNLVLLHDLREVKNSVRIILFLPKEEQQKLSDLILHKYISLGVEFLEEKSMAAIEAIFLKYKTKDTHNFETKDKGVFNLKKNNKEIKIKKDFFKIKTEPEEDFKIKTEPEEDQINISQKETDISDINENQKDVDDNNKILDTASATVSNISNKVADVGKSTILTLINARKNASKAIETKKNIRKHTQSNQKFLKKKNPARLKNVFCICSSASTGKSFFASNLAVLLSKFKHNVVLLDVSSHQAQFNLFKMPCREDTLSCILDAKTPEEYMPFRTKKHPNLQIFACDPETKPVLKSTEIKNFIEYMSQNNDFVIIDMAQKLDMEYAQTIVSTCEISFIICDMYICNIQKILEMDLENYSQKFLIFNNFIKLNESQTDLLREYVKPDKEFIIPSKYVENIKSQYLRRFLVEINDEILNSFENIYDAIKQIQGE